MSRPLINNQVSIISIPGQGYMTYNTYTWTIPSAITLPGGIKRENTYTPIMQLKSLNVKDPAQTALMSYNYDYSPAGNVTAKNTEQGNYAYQYDDIYRLTGATNPSVTESFTYDPVGNRLTSIDVHGDWSYNQNNELLSYNGVSFEYDPNGNIIGKTDQTGTTTLTYDVDNRLIQLVTPNSQLVTYYYDPFGRRLWKEVSGVRTYFFYSDEGLIGEYNATGVEIKTYGYAPNSTWTTNPLFQKIGTNYYWYQNDHLGTPQKITDGTGAIVWSGTYDSFGKTEVQIGAIENNLRFPGQYFDQETGLYYNWNRYYDPKTGRYLTPDPIGQEGGINLFLYVANNPLNSADPFGLEIRTDPKTGIPYMPQPKPYYPCGPLGCGYVECRITGDGRIVYGRTDLDPGRRICIDCNPVALVGCLTKLTPDLLMNCGICIGSIIYGIWTGTGYYDCAACAKCSSLLLYRMTGCLVDNCRIGKRDECGRCNYN